MGKQFFSKVRVFYQEGFTLIELLVVLGILGILAAALLAAINPVEQLNKARDAALENTASEFISATVQYYAAHNTLPWTTGCYPSAGLNGQITSVSLSSLSNCITNPLVSEGELKQSFLSNTANLQNIYITSTGPNTTMACFQPQSHTVQADANSKYNQNGTVNASCPSVGNSCYWCAQ